MKKIVIEWRLIEENGLWNVYEQINYMPFSTRSEAEAFVDGAKTIVSREADDDDKD